MCGKENDMPTILYPPTIDWEFLFQRPQQIMIQFAKNGWQVYYANKTQRYKEVEEVKPNLYLYHDFSILRRKIKEVDILYITSPHQYYLVDKIKAGLVIYDCLDQFQEWVKYEEDMIERADIIFASSEYLYQEKKKYHKKVFLIRNGCDYNHLQNNDKVPIEMTRLKRPIIGMVGAVGSWVDKNILAEVAYGYTTVLIGLEFGSKLPEGVIQLGNKAYQDLPQYYNSIDLGIIPFDQSVTSIAANPIKMYEYLAAGKPIVASSLPEMKTFPDFIYTADSPEEFVVKIDTALRDNNKMLIEKRKKAACENTWKMRFEKIESILNLLL